MKEQIKGWLEAIFEAAVIIIILFFVFFPFEVSGSSMENTLHNGDKVFVSRIMATAGMYEKGDMVMFVHSFEGKKIKMVKRVIACEGDRVVIKDGLLYINDEMINEEYVLGETDGDTDVYIEHGKVFVMGDNRSFSVDSRDFGAIDKRSIKGRVVMKLLPLGDFTVYAKM